MKQIVLSPAMLRARMLIAAEIGWQDPMTLQTCNKEPEPEPTGEMTRQRRRQAARLAAKGRDE